MIVGVPSSPAALMRPRLHAAPAVRVLHITHRILNELIVNFDLRPNTQLSNNNNVNKLLLIVI